MGGDDVEMQEETLYEVEVVQDISLRSPAEAGEAQVAVGDGDDISPQPYSSSSPTTVESQSEKDAGATPSSTAAAELEDQQQAREPGDETEQNAEEGHKDQGQQQQPEAEVMTVMIVEEEEATIEEEEVSVESASPVDYSFEVSPPPVQDMAINTALDNEDDDDMFDVVVKDVSLRGVIQRSITRISIQTETIFRHDDDDVAAEGEEEQAGENDEQGQGDDPDQEAALDAVPHEREATTTKEVMVCKHCGLEFPYALREMKNHRSECEVFQQKKVLESEAGLRDIDENESKAQDEDESKVHDDGEAMAPDADQPVEHDDDQSMEHDDDQSLEREEDESKVHDGESNTHDDDEVMESNTDQPVEHGGDGLAEHGAEKSMEHNGDEASEKARDDTVSKRGDDDEAETNDCDSEAKSTSPKQAPHDKATQPRSTEAVAQVEEDGFRLFADSSPSASAVNVAKSTKAECLGCGKVLAYNKRSMSRHGKSCSSRLVTADCGQHDGDDDEEDDTTAAASPAMARASVLRVMKGTPKMTKRKLMSIEDAIAASSPRQQQQSRQRDDDEHESQDKPTTSNARTADFQTPRRSKRIKRDPTHSPAVAPIAHDTKPAPKVAQPSSHLRPSPPPPSPPPIETKSKKSRIRRKTVTPHTGAKAGSSARNSAVMMRLRGEAAHMAPDFQVPVFSNTRSDDRQSMDHRTKRAWLFGSLENADTIKSHYRESAQWIHAPCSRFQQLTHEHLFDLKLAALLEHLPPSAAITLLVDAMNANLHSMGTAIVSKSEARVMYNLGLSISFSAPEAIREMLVTPLAHDLKTSPLVEPQKHEVRIMCCRSGFTYNWQFRCDDVFILLLKGSVQWRTKKATVSYPVREYKPQLVPLSSQHNDEAGEETHLKVHSKSLDQKHASTLLPPVEDYHMDDQDDDDQATSKTTLEPGSVVYMSGGTWFEAEVADDATWLEVRIANYSASELVCDALKQLLSRDEQWRRPLEASQDAKPMRRHVDHLLKDLGAKISSLSPSDLLPEALLGSDEPLGSDVSHPIAAGSNIVIDIRRHAFKGGKYSKVFKTSGFRENPLAVLMAMHEIPSYTAHVESDDGGTPPNKSNTPTSASKKKALRKKPKRKPAASMTRSARDENAYVVHVHCGAGSDFHSKLRVQFQCNPFQAALVEWIREKQGTCFHVSEVLKFAQQQQLKKPHDVEDATKYVLRFLQTVGFLSPVKMPSPEKV